jgi:branched-chain amino acid aminotransferase
LAREKGFDQILWLDALHHKFIQEVGTMNIFFVFKDEIVTPSTLGAILKGITRKSAIEIMQSKGQQVTEREISIDEVVTRYQAGELVEIFGTGTAALVANVEEIKYQDLSIRLDSSNWKLSVAIRDEINGMRFGTMEDKRGWTVPVKEVEVTA